MNINLIDLSNGFKIIHIEKKGSEIVSMSLRGKAGSSFEKTPGTAHFLEHVALSGSKKYPSKKELVSNIQKYGGYTGGSTGKEFVEYIVKIIQSEVENGFDFLSQVAFSPLLLENDIEKERRIILQECKRALSNNQRQLFENMLQASYTSDTMKNMVLGNKDSIDKITKNDLTSFWKEYYSINNFVLCVCGDIDEEKARLLGEKYFGALQASTENNDFIKHEKNEQSSIEILHREDANQARILLSYFSPEFPTREYYVAQLISHILGKGVLSKLYQSIREKNQLAYDVNTRIWSGYEYGIFYVDAGISEEKINKVLDLASKEFKTISEKALADDELKMFKKQFESFLLFGFENSLQMASYHSRHFYTSSGLMDYKKELEIIKTITSEDIMKVSSEMFSNKLRLSVLAKNTTEKDIHLDPLL